MTLKPYSGGQLTSYSKKCIFFLNFSLTKCITFSLMKFKNRVKPLLIKSFKYWYKPNIADINYMHKTVLFYGSL